MKRLAPLTFLLLAALSSLSATAEQPSSFRYYKQVDQAGASQGEILRLPLDAEVHAATRDDSADLRLFDYAMEEIPYMLELAPGEGAGVEYPIVEFTVEEDPSQKSTIVEITVRREPLTGFRLETCSENFQRRASLEAFDESGSRPRWEEIARATIAVVRLDDVEREQLRFTFPESRHKRYRMVIRNQDNRPLEIDGVTALGNTWRLVFLASGDDNPRLYYGSKTARRPNYETAAVLGPSRKNRQAKQASLSPQVANADYQAPLGRTLGDFMNNRLWLGLAIGLMIVVLTWTLYRASRRIEALEEGDTTPEHSSD